MAKRPNNRMKSREKGFEWLARVITVIAIILTAVVSLIAVLVFKATRGLDASDVVNINNAIPSGVTKIYAADINRETGEHILLGEVSNRYQRNVTIEAIPRMLQLATIDIEDERFYDHKGVDLRSLARAIYKNITRLKMAEGASTLTQQLAINRLLTRKKTVDRKLQGMLYAIKMESTLSKQTILERYLNEVNYGGNIYGVAAAAEYYFTKPLNRLSIADCAYIAGLPQRPYYTNPFRFPDAAINRRNIVLAKMRDLNHITQDEYQAAMFEVPRINPVAPKIRTSFRAPHFTNWVLRRLVNDPSIGKDRIYQGGLKVYTTLSIDLQRKATDALKAGIKTGSDSGVTEGAVVSLDPTNGYVRALVGSSDYTHSNFNYALGRSQCGSTFKPFVYAAAFGDDKLKLTPDSSRYDGPHTYGDWTPKNYGGRYSRRSVSLRSALATSKNSIAVQLANETGITNVIATAKQIGLRNVVMNRDLTLALGTAAVSPLELSTAYSTFANGGSYVEPVSILRVEDSDQMDLWTHQPERRSNVLRSTVVSFVDECLKAVIDYGSAAGAAGIHEIEGARGKTGTTSDNRDAWFAGYTPSLVTTVYMCGVKRVRRGNSELVKYLPMQGVTGGRICAPVWSSIMQDANQILALLKTPSERPKNEVQTMPPRVTPRIVVPTAQPPDAIVDTVPEDAGLESRPSTLDPETAIPSDNQPSGIEPVLPEPSIPAPESVRPVRRIESKPELRPDPRPEPEIEVLICADSNSRASEYCPEVVRQILPKSKAPKRTCTKHGAQQDERPNE